MGLRNRFSTKKATPLSGAFINDSKQREHVIAVCLPLKRSLCEG